MPNSWYVTPPVNEAFKKKLVDNFFWMLWISMYMDFKLEGTLVVTRLLHSPAWPGPRLYCRWSAPGPAAARCSPRRPPGTPRSPHPPSCCSRYCLHAEVIMQLRTSFTMKQSQTPTTLTIISPRTTDPRRCSGRWWRRAGRRRGWPRCRWPGWPGSRSDTASR